MAKKLSINIFEAHMEKVALVVALAVLGLVVFVGLIDSPTIDTSSGREKPSQALAQAAEQAAEIADDQKQAGGKMPPDYVGIAPSLIDGKIQKLLVAETSLFPRYGGEKIEREKRIYEVPDIPALDKVQIEFARTMVRFPVESTEYEEDTPRRSRGLARMDTEERDIDLVSIEAVFPLKDLYNRFEKSFGPEVTIPLDNYEPVIAFVQLARRKLLSSGNWSELEIVPRLKVDEMAAVEGSVQRINELTTAHFQVVIDDRRDYSTQLSLLQPSCYDYVEGEWLSAEAKAEKEKEEKGKKKSKRSTKGKKSTQPSIFSERADMRPGTLTALPEGRNLAMSRRRGMRPGSGKEGMEKPEELKKEKVTLWSFDDSVQPGGIYQYQIRVGFFNPIADHDWFKPEQKSFKAKRILWSEWADAGKKVKVPPRTAFFPRLVSSSGVVKAEMYRRQDGLWHKDSFRITPTTVIGEIVQPKAVKKAKKTKRKSIAQDSEDDQEKKAKPVDFRADIMVLDMIPGATHWFSNISTVCPDIIYVNREGNLERLPADKKGWPDSMSDDKSKISAALKQQEKDRRQKKPRKR